jgi:hypothetical protein
MPVDFRRPVLAVQVGTVHLPASSARLPDTAAGKTSKRTSKNIGKCKSAPGKSEERNYKAKLPVKLVSATNDATFAPRSVIAYGLASRIARKPDGLTVSAGEHICVTPIRTIWKVSASLVTHCGVIPATLPRVVSARSAREARFFAAILRRSDPLLFVQQMQNRGYNLREKYALTLGVDVPTCPTWYAKKEGSSQCLKRTREEELEKRIAYAEYLLSAGYKAEQTANREREERAGINKRNKNQKRQYARLCRKQANLSA